MNGRFDPQGDKSFSLKLAAGDDTEQEPVTIRLAPRPIVSELFASISPPAYVKNAADPAKPAAAVMVDLLTQSGPPSRVPPSPSASNPRNLS